MTSQAEHRKVLESRLAELEARLNEIEAELVSRNTPDWEELAQESEHDEVLEDMGRTGSAEIRMIRAALERMEAGDYGYCAKCGDDIAAGRLEILPATPFCAKCATAVSSG